MNRTFLRAGLLIIITMITGCILSTTPEDAAEVIMVGQSVQFEIQVFPEPPEFTWYIDGVAVPGYYASHYSFSPSQVGDHVITVEGGEDSFFWFVHVIDEGFIDYNQCVADVEDAFERITIEGAKLSFWDEGLIPWPRYTQAIVNEIGIDNHFQGIQRLRKGPFVVISGSNILDRTGSIYVAQMGSRPSQGAFGSNLDEVALPPCEDKLIQAIDVDSGLLWHAGGMSVIGDILVVPLEEYQEDIVSKIYFYDVSDPENPVRYNYFIDRTDGLFRDKAGAVAIEKLSDNRFILATWDTRVLHFYLSISEDIEDGFDCENVVTWDKEDLLAEEGLDTNFAGQAINFIRQCDGELYMVAFDGFNGDLGPFLPYLEIINIADLFHIEFPDNDLASVPLITKVASKEMYCDDTENPFIPSWRIPSHCDFVAAAGLYIDEYGCLSVYSAPHYRSAGIIKFSEFIEN